MATDGVAIYHSGMVASRVVAPWRSISAAGIHPQPSPNGQPGQPNTGPSGQQTPQGQNDVFGGLPGQGGPGNQANAGTPGQPGGQQSTNGQFGGQDQTGGQGGANQQFPTQNGPGN